ncbi:lipoprotein [uncultured Sphingomonas sp.]|uniref:lipoprotein n=1 Tax=uncultured Sphingomonas sp. TaxID=158754 RepID=UPI00374849F9
MRILAAFGLLALAACGSRGDLKPAEGKALPVKPYGATATPTATDLMQPSVQARPRRGDDLQQTSDRRARDDFDLPPK